MIEKNQPVNFWIGVVTVIDDDPEKQGRVRVRIIGKHHHDPNVLKNEDLPLAQVLIPPIYASLSGAGHTPTGLLPGSWVVGFFMDPEIENMPVILGSLPGIQFPEDNTKEVKASKDKTGEQADLVYGVERSAQKGWVNKADKYGLCDPDEVYPLYTSQLPYGKKIDASDVNSKIQQSVEYNEHDFRHRKDSLMVACSPNEEKKPKLEETNTIKEPFMAEPAYMKNHVYESSSGHIKEFDDTPGKERIYEQHKSGTFQEIQADGSRITKVFGEDYDICLNGKTIIINSGPNGANGLKIVVNGNVSLNTSGSVIERIFGDYTQIVHGKISVNAKKGIAFESWYGDVSTKVHNQKKFTVYANDNIELTTDNCFVLKACSTSSFSGDIAFSGQGSFSGNTSIGGDCVIGGQGNAAGGMASGGLMCDTSPAPSGAQMPNMNSPPCSPDKEQFPWNQCPLVGWSTKKSKTGSSTTGWDYHDPDEDSTTYKKHHYETNFKPISSVSKNSYNGDDGSEGSQCTDFIKFDYYKFSYSGNQKTEWYEKPYKNESERGSSGQIFRKKLKVGSNYESSFGWATDS
jgi:hypothetical protein